MYLRSWMLATEMLVEVGRRPTLLRDSCFAELAHCTMLLFATDTELPMIFIAPFNYIRNRRHIR
jgi:hypothetical protein